MYMIKVWFLLTEYRLIDFQFYYLLRCLTKSLITSNRMQFQYFCTSEDQPTIRIIFLNRMQKYEFTNIPYRYLDSQNQLHILSVQAKCIQCRHQEKYFILFQKTAYPKRQIWKDIYEQNQPSFLFQILTSFQQFNQISALSIFNNKFNNMNHQDSPQIDSSSPNNTTNTPPQSKFKKPLTSHHKKSNTFKQLPRILIDSESEDHNPETNPQTKKSVNFSQNNPQSAVNQSQISIDSSFERNMYGKMENLLNRTKILEKKLKKKGDETPKCKPNIGKLLGLGSKSSKNILVENKTQQIVLNIQQQTSSVLSPIWQLTLCQPYVLQQMKRDSGHILDIISMWKNTNLKYKQNFEKLCKTLNVFTIEQALQKAELLSSKSRLVEQKQDQILKLNQMVSSFRSQQSISYLGKSKSVCENLNIRSSGLINQVNTLSQKTDVQTLSKQNNRLKQQLNQIQSQKNQLILTLNQEVNNIKQSIIQEVQSKIELTKSLLTAQNYIVNLKKATEHQIQTLQQIIKRERQSTSKLIESLNGQSSTNLRVGIFQIAGQSSLSKLDNTIDEEIKSKEYLNDKLQNSFQRIKYLQGLLEEAQRVANQHSSEKMRLQSSETRYLMERKYIKQQIQNVNMFINESNQRKHVQSQETIDGQLSELNQSVIYLLSKLNNIDLDRQNTIRQCQEKQQQLEKCHNEIETLRLKIRLEKNNTLREDYIQINNKCQQLQRILLEKQEEITKLSKQVHRSENQGDISTTKKIPNRNGVKSHVSIQKNIQKQNKRKMFQRLEILKGTESQTFRNKNKNEKTCDTKKSTQTQQKNDIKTTKKLAIKKMTSLCSINNLNTSIEEENVDEILPKRSCFQEVNDNRSQISIWKQSSSTINLAIKIDSECSIGFQIDDLFERMNLIGDIPILIKQFLKKIELNCKNKSLLNETEEFLYELKNTMEYQSLNGDYGEQFLKKQLEKMGQVFAQIQDQENIYIQKRNQRDEILSQQSGQAPNDNFQDLPLGSQIYC